MIRNFRKRVYESNKVPKSEQDLLDSMKQYQPSYADSFREELSGEPFDIDYGSSSFEAIGQFIEKYFYDQMKLLKIGSWKLDDFMFDDNYVFFDYKNKKSKFMNTRIGFEWDYLSLSVYAESDDIPEEDDDLIEGFSVKFPSPEEFSSQAEYLIAICNTIADNEDKVSKFTKKVLFSIDKELQKEIDDTYNEMSRAYAKYKNLYNQYLELGGDEESWENGGKHRIDSSL